MTARDIIVVISSHVARGAVGNRIIVPVLERAGFDVWVVPTVLLPYHPGVGRGARLVPDDDIFVATLADLVASGVSRVRAIISGYLGAAGQADAISNFVRAVKKRQPNCCYICDPVIGDVRGLYVPDATALAMRDVLVPIADVITPNRYEHDWLTGSESRQLSDWIEASRLLAPSHQLITSAPGDGRAPIGNLLLSPDGIYYCGHAQFNGVPHGTGDLVSALTAICRAQTLDCEQTLRIITQGVFDVVCAAYDSGADDLDTRPANDSTCLQLSLHRIG